MNRNRDNLLKAPDGRYRAGVVVERDAHGAFVAEVLVARKGVEAGEIIPLHAMRLPPLPSAEVAAEQARAWAFAHIPRIFDFKPQDLGVELLDGRVFQLTHTSATATAENIGRQ